MANKIPVKFYYDTMPGMPQITNQYGDMVNVLDTVLANGGAWNNVVSVTFADGFITVTTASAHNYVRLQVIELEGANQADYNGEFRISEIVSATSFKAIMTVIPAQSSASGTMRHRIPPLGYEIAFTGTNKRAYRSKNIAGTRPYLRVDNSADPAWNGTYSIKSRVTAARSMSDIDTFTAGRMPFDPSNPTMNETVTGTGNAARLGWFTWIQTTAHSGIQPTDQTSIAGSNTNRMWMIVGDDRAFWLVIYPGPRTSTSWGRVAYGFGEYDSRKPNDQFNYFLVASESTIVANTGYYLGNTVDLPMSASRSSNQGMIIPRNFSGFGYHEKFAATSHTFTVNSAAYSGATASIPYPNGPDYSMWFCPRYIAESTRGDIRGILPGTYFIPHSITMADLSIIENVMIDGNASDRKMMLTNVCHGSTADRVLAFDIIGPWRKN